jgi:NAD(P)-dependent dehydrogenase (short-subunit alcohol dehydrogenase family)
MTDPTSETTPALTSFPGGGAAVVFGAGGGLGRASLEALQASDRFAAVTGFARSGSPPVDVTDEATIAAAAEQVRAAGLPLRLVLDATGFLHDAEHGGPEKTYRRIDPDHLAHAFAVNATGPALLMKHFLPLLPREGKAAFATLSAKVGSIGDNRFGGWFAYRASKAALNQLVRTAAIELARSRPEALCVALHPGTTDTELSAPFSKRGLSVRPPAESARRLLAVLERLSASDTGGFFSHDGSALPW